MSDLISRETIKKQMNATCRNCDARFDVKECGRCGMEWAREIVRSAPAVDAVPVVHGYWEMRGQDAFCSKCGGESKYTWYGASAFSNFCPNRGAKMDGGNDG